jgi:hypothetical protein
MTDQNKPLTGITAADPTSAEACKAQLARLAADRSINPRVRAVGIARRYREELTDPELASLLSDLSDELQRHKSALVVATTLEHHCRRLVVLEAAINVLRVRTVAGLRV